MTATPPNSDSPSIFSTVCTLATGAAIVAAGLGIPILSAASTGLSSLNNALGRSEREFSGSTAGSPEGAGSTPTPEPVNGETEFPMPPTTQTAADAATGAEWLRQAASGGGGRGRMRVKRVVEGDVVDTRSDSHKAFVKVQVPTKGSCTGAVVDKNKVLTAAHCVVSSRTKRVKAADLEKTFIELDGQEYNCTLSIPGESVQIDVEGAGSGIKSQTGDQTNNTTSKASGDSTKTTQIEKDVDVVLCTTDRDMDGVQVVPIMTRESMKDIWTKHIYSDDNIAPNLSPFANAYLVGMGNVGRGVHDSLVAKGLKKVMGDNDGEKMYSDMFPANPQDDQHVSWSNLKEAVTRNGRAAYAFQPAEMENKDYAVNFGDSGAGIMMFDLKDRVYKLISVLSKKSDDGIYSGDNFLNLTEAKYQNITDWVNNNGLNGSLQIDNPYNLFNDPYFPEPPTRIPDKPDPDKRYSVGKVSGRSPKYPVGNHTFPTNTTEFFISNQLNDTAFVNLNGSLWNDTVNFQGTIPPRGNISRQMPAGFSPYSMEINENGLCHRKHVTVTGNSTGYGFEMFSSTPVNGTRTVHLSSTGNIKSGSFQDGSNCTLPQTQTSPFWLSQRPATLTKTAFIATPAAAASAGAGFVVGMFLLAACIKCCSKPNKARTEADKKLSKDVTVKAKNSLITGEHQNLRGFIDHWLGQGYTVPSVNSQGQLFLHKPEGGPGMNLSKSFPNKGNSKGYAETGFCYALIQVSDGGGWPQPYFDDSEGWEQPEPSSAPSPSLSHENIELDTMGGNQGEDLDTDSLRELEALLGAAGGVNPSPTLNLDLFGEWAARQDNR